MARSLLTLPTPYPAPRLRRTALLVWAILITIIMAAPTQGAPKKPDKSQPLLSFGKFRQGLSISSNFSDSDSTSNGNSTSSSTLKLSETYNLSFLMVAVRPSLLKGSFNFGAMAQQQQISSNDSSSDNSTFSLNYRINTTMMAGSAHPLSVSAFSVISQAEGSDSPTYTINSEGQSVSLSLNNRYLPLTVGYTHSTTEGQGASTETEGFSIGSAVGLPFLGVTASASRGNSTARPAGGYAPSTTDTTSFTLSGTTGHGGKRTTWELRSNFQYNEDHSAERYRIQRQLRNTLEIKPGKVLLIKGNLDLTSNENELRWNKGTSASGSVSHLLFENLRSMVNGYWSNSQYQEGDVTSYGGNLQLGYTKLLPRNSSMGLSYGYGINYNRQDMTVDALPVDNERHAIPVGAVISFFEIELGQPDIEPTSVIVNNEQQTVTYTEGIDYRVEQRGNRTWLVLLPPSGNLLDITGGDTLLVSYTYAISQRLAYMGTSNSFGGTMTYRSRYALSTNLTLASSEVLEGSDATGQTRDSLAFTLTGSANFPGTTYDATYGYSEQQTTSTHSIGAGWHHNRYTRYGNLGLGAQERFTTSSTGKGSSWHNTLSLNTSFSRMLYSRVRMTFIGMYRNLLNEDTLNNYLGLNLQLSTSLGRTRVSLNGKTNFNFNDSTYSRSSSVSLYLSRSF